LFAREAQRRVDLENSVSLLPGFGESLTAQVVQGDAVQLGEISALHDTTFHYAVTSPPYWMMLHNRGSEYQTARRKTKLPLTNSDDARDLGNMQDYDQFLDALFLVYSQLADWLKSGSHLTVVVKNMKRERVNYSLAWDLTARLCGDGGKYDYAGHTLWCQD